MTLVTNIEAYCRREGITEAEFERKCGLAKGSVCKWRNGTIGSPNLKSVAKIQTATGISQQRWMRERGIVCRT